MHNCKFDFLIVSVTQTLTRASKTPHTNVLNTHTSINVDKFVCGSIVDQNSPTRERTVKFPVTDVAMSASHRAVGGHKQAAGQSYVMPRCQINVHTPEYKNLQSCKSSSDNSSQPQQHRKITEAVKCMTGNLSPAG